MKRDLNLVKEILERVEGAEGWVNFELSEDGTETLYHAKLLIQANLLESDAAKPIRDQKGQLRSVAASGLTWEGHDFLDSTRDARSWGKVSDYVGKGGAWTFSVVKGVLTKLAATQAEEFIENM